MANPINFFTGVLSPLSKTLLEKLREMFIEPATQPWEREWVYRNEDYEVHTVWSAKDGTEIKAWVMRADNPRGTMFFAHGFTRCANDLLGQGRGARDGLHLCSVGWDARMHGNSGNGPLSFGYNESFDVEALVNKARELGLPRPYIIQGVSLGGMTARIAARRIPQIDGAIVIQAPANPYIAIDRAPNTKFKALLRALLENSAGDDSLWKGVPANCPMHAHARPMVLEVLGTDDRYGYEDSKAAFEAWPGPKAYQMSPGDPETQEMRFFRLDLEGCVHPGEGRSFDAYPQVAQYSAALVERVIREYAARLAANAPDLVWDSWREGDYFFSIGDYAKAVELYGKSAESGDEWGLFNMGKCHDFGLGVPLNKRKAQEYYRRSAAMGNDWAAKYGGWLDTHEAYIRMTDGEPYGPDEPALREIREHAGNRARQFEEQEDQGILRREMHISDSSFITPPFTWGYGGNIFMAEGTYVNKCCHFDDSAPIYIGRNVIFGPGVHIITSQDAPEGNGMKVAKPVVIGDNCWICGKVTIHPGVRIGAGAVVAASAVVTEDVPCNALVAGNPAHVERMIEQ